MKKNLRKNNGFTGIDISISMIIILIFIPTIFGVIYNIQKARATTNRKATAVNLASNVLEIVKSEDYGDVSVEDSSKMVNDINKDYALSNYKNTEKEELGYEYIYYSYIGKNDEHYQIQVGVKNYYPSNTDMQDLIKMVKVTVFYPIGNDIKDINIGLAVQNT